MIVCPRDLLLGGSLDAPYVCMCVCVCVHVCTCVRKRSREEHRDLSLGRERVSRKGKGGEMMVGRDDIETLEVYREIKESRIYNVRATKLVLRWCSFSLSLAR